MALARHGPGKLQKEPWIVFPLLEIDRLGFIPTAELIAMFEDARFVGTVIARDASAVGVDAFINGCRDRAAGHGQSPLLSFLLRLTVAQNGNTANVLVVIAGHSGDQPP